MKMTKAQLETKIADLQDRNSYLEGRVSDRDSWVRSFEQEKREHKTTCNKVSELGFKIQDLEDELVQSRLTIAKLMTQNVRLQGRIEGVLIMTGHLQLNGEKK